MKTTFQSNIDTTAKSFRPLRRLCGLAVAAIGLGASIPSAQAVDYVAATGGTVTTHREAATVVTVHTFTGDGTFTVTTGGTVNYLVVGGGGGGGGFTGGGGGAGGFLTGTTSVTGTAYTITVGGGGAGGAGNGNPEGFGTNGGNSEFASLTAFGGGGGAPNGDSGSADGKPGGSGGGGSYVDSASAGGAATSGQGNAGGACLDWGGPYTPGGGGGAGAVGTDGNRQGSGADGGAGLSSTIADGVTATWYAGGGGSGNYNGNGGSGGSGGGGAGGNPGSPVSGAANTGGGGGGQGQNSGDTAGSGGSGIVIISYVSGVSSAPYSTGASLTVPNEVATALAASNFGYNDPGSVALAAVQITSLPALGTLKLSGSPVTLNQIVSVADITAGNLTYTSAGPTFGTGATHTTFAFKVENANTLWSDAAVMPVNVTPDILVQNGSFETPGVDGAATYWWSIGSPWTSPYSDPYPQYMELDFRGFGQYAFNSGADGFYGANMDTGYVSYDQDLSTTVDAGETLSVTVSGGRPKSSPGGQFTVTFVVGTTEYTSPVIDTTLQDPNTWQSYTFTIPIANTGNLSLSFRAVTSGGWLDKVSNISVTSGSGPTPGSYADWALTNAPGQDPGQDYNNDGVLNGVAYFMGVTGPATNPGLDASNTVTWPASGTFSGTYKVQTSPDLSTWTDVASQPTPSGGNLTYVLPPDAPGGKSFVRLQVTPN